NTRNPTSRRLLLRRRVFDEPPHARMTRLLLCARGQDVYTEFDSCTFHHASGYCDTRPAFTIIDREVCRNAGLRLRHVGGVGMDQRDVRAAWETFLERGALSADLRLSVAASWQRSKNHRITTDRAMAPMVAEAELFRHRSKHA